MDFRFARNAEGGRGRGGKSSARRDDTYCGYTGRTGDSGHGILYGDICNYTKYVFVPKEWEDGCVGLVFDGAMMNATVDVNGCKAASQHMATRRFMWI